MKLVLNRKNLLSTGSTRLNLEISGKYYGGIYKGAYVLIVGDSDSGKSVVGRTCFAEATLNRHFDDYELILDNPEGGALLDIRKFYGKAVAKQLISPPNGDSEFLEDFYYNLWDLIKEGKQFIYLLDSMDALEPRDDARKFAKKRNAARNNQETAGSYGTLKAKMNSENLRKIAKELEKTGSILIIISQSRDAIGGPSFFGPRKTRGGGRAMKFYTRIELWLSTMKQIKKKVNDTPRQIGILSKIKIEKNHVRGNKGSITIPIYNATGLNDAESCVDFLLAEKHWKKKSKGVVHAPDLDLTLPRAKLIRQIVEDPKLEKQVGKIMQKVWNEIDAKTNTGISKYNRE